VWNLDPHERRTSNLSGVGVARPLEDLPDVELLASYARGEAAAFAILLERHQRPLFNFLLRSTRNTTDAEDLLQETWTRVLRNPGGFDQRSKFTTWLYTIARNLCIDHARKGKHRRHASLDAHASEGGSTLAQRVPAQQPDTERTAESERLGTRIAAAVETLPDEQREVFLLRQLQQMPFAEIAAVVGAPENTVKSRMRYALERLQTELADFQDAMEASS
jgi:RNA polymerase sigma-70 factor (ECF subfamily)